MIELPETLPVGADGVSGIDGTLMAGKVLTIELPMALVAAIENAYVEPGDNLYIVALVALALVTTGVDSDFSVIV